VFAFVCLTAACSDAHASKFESTEESVSTTTSNEHARRRESTNEPSPRDALTAFLELCRDGAYEQAASYLELDDEQVNEGPRLARRLKAVLDRHLWFDLDQISDATTGALDDGLAADLEEVGAIPGPGSTMRPVLLHRAADPSQGWRFSATTVGNIEKWYNSLDNHWLLEHLPTVLLRPGPADILIWQWLALPLLGLVAWIIGRIAALISVRLLTRFVHQTMNQWDDTLLARSRRPLTIAWSLSFAYLTLPALQLYLPAQTFLHATFRALAIALFFWILLIFVGVVQQIAVLSQWAQEHPTYRALLPLAARVGNVVIIILAIMAFVAEFGYSISTMLAGLGIGGLAVALAAQKTVENLIGAFSIGADQPFREGDFVRVEDFVGTVEAIGLRSTRIRTLDRTLISLPNGRLADMRIESYSARDRIRLACVVGLVYNTTPAQMREILAGLEQVLRDQEKIWPDAVVVRFKEFGASSLDIEIMAWFLTQDWGEFQLIRQNIFLRFMEVVENAKSSFAFPTRTVHLVHEGEASTPALEAR
jgi:MscS family membrane protein